MAKVGVKPPTFRSSGWQRALAQPGRTLVEEHRVDALHPCGVLAAQVVIGLQQRPVLQDAHRPPAQAARTGRWPSGD
jgi:hypothetical protein